MVKWCNWQQKRSCKFFPSDLRNFHVNCSYDSLAQEQNWCCGEGLYNQQSQIPYNSAFCYPVAFFACECVSFFCKHSDYFHRFRWRFSSEGKHCQEQSVFSSIWIQTFLTFSCANKSLNLTFKHSNFYKRLQSFKNCAIFWNCSKFRNFHLMEKLFSAPLIGTFHLEPPLISETFWESSSLHRLWRISSQSLCLEHFIGIVRRKCVCMTGFKPRFMCFLKKFVGIHFPSVQMYIYARFVKYW